MSSEQTTLRCQQNKNGETSNMKTTVIKAIARTIDALHRCEQNPEQYAAAIEMHKDRLAMLEGRLPGGSGIDNGTMIDVDASCRNRIVLCAGYHHMDDGGGYDGWTQHRIVVKPDLALDFTVSIGGRDRNGIKDYLAEVYQTALAEEIEY